MLLVRQLFGASANSWARALIIFVLAWVGLVYVFVVKLTNTQGQQAAGESELNARRISQALQMLEHTRQRNEELKQLIDELMSDQLDKQSALKLVQRLENDALSPKLAAEGAGVEPESMFESAPADLRGWNNVAEAAPNDLLEGAGGPEHVDFEPSLEYEFTRRRIQTNIAEIWNFFSSELGKVRKSVAAGHGNADLEESINQVLLQGAEHKRSLLSDMERLRLRLRLSTASCGVLLIVAYATERTLILKSRGWRYHKGGWEEVFQPVSNSCHDAGTANTYNWPGKPNTQVLVLPIIDSLMPRPPYLPLAVPEDLAPRLKRLHGDPIVWWVGQFLKYLLRPQTPTRDFLVAGMRNLGWERPIVGVHVRRTDKVGTEAACHSVEEYMTHVEDYYRTLEVNGSSVARRIFLASDDAQVIEEARRKYPQYQIIGDPEVARMASVSTRYTDTALNGIILDIHLLSMSDHLVCTFSSQVCRVAYEIMQTLYPDAAHRFKSLDDIYYYGGQNAHNRRVVIAHKPRTHEDLQLRVGDLVSVAGNHWDGNSKGKNTRTNQGGLFPSFKVEEKVDTAKLPLYAGV
ncbi:hypothetical protein M5D96_012456 [Drosophila gunungcola]|uniref:Alpha-(1,6)-fucosyltransferase n=1 Tax=Drosophila gunungcola TaxID=103775 RepID=A0A9Q0BJT9_9MUSC|nr:hypothetical protein M5D96_012456 [Drosophila gunungcola]